MYANEARTLNASTNSHAVATARGPAPRSPRYRSRDFGTGYGNSSGYATGRRYASGSPPARFRLV